MLLIAVAATITFSSCASQGLAGSSSALNGTAANSLSGAPNPFNTQGVAHDVNLNWKASASSGVMGYNVYRGNGPGGPYMKLNTSLIEVTSYTDDGVQAGETYYYVVTATTSTNVESIYSNEVSAAVP